MTPELMVWLVVSLLGLVALPFVGRRRAAENRWHALTDGNGIRRLIHQNRTSRAAILSIGVVLSAGVAIVSWLLSPSDGRRLLSVGMLIGVEISIVLALVLDEYFAHRIDHYGENP